MKVNHVETIVAIAEAGSLRAAARTLQKSQPALTKTLKQAEEELGAKIFARAARGVEPTEIGRKIIARARMISAEFRKLDEDIRQIQGDGSGNLHVIVSPLAAVRIVPQVMDRFRRQFPHVHLQVAGGHPPAALAVLRSGEADLVIGPVPGKEDRAGLTIRNLLKTPLAVITGKGSRYAGATRLSELGDAEWIMVGPRKRSFGIAADFVAAGLPVPDPITTSDSITSLLAMIEGSDRLCSFPALMLEEILPRWQIVALALADPVGPVQIGLMSLADRPLTPAGQAFADAVVNRASHLVATSSDNLE
ncbi:MAG: LysR family transcriptional regulator [Alphaproteobacteria bacterium]|nr:LysR family transcriptional regulator [Alphaproteobacteria bacterium]